MEKQSLKLHHVREVSKNVVQIGSDFFLFDTNSISIRKEILFEEYYKWADFIYSEAIHLHIDKSFLLRGSIFSVYANHSFGYGPLGDRIKVKAHYNGECIGDFRALRSYMGGGANGNWPQLIKDDWQVIILFEENSDRDESLNYFSVGYYETIYQAAAVTHEKGTVKSINEENLTDPNFFKELFSIEELEENKKIFWSVDKTGPNKNGTFSLCCYPDFQRYRFKKYGKISDWRQQMEASEPFIARRYEQTGSLITLEYSEDGQTDIHFPWTCVEILGQN